MKFVNAKRLRNRDQVQVRVAPAIWLDGHLIGDPLIQGKTILVNVYVPFSTYLESISHTNIR